MSDEQKGEWKLLKVWECHECKTLLRDGRKVYEHRCGINNDKSVEEKVVEKVIEEKVVEKIVERIVYVGGPNNGNDNERISADIWRDSGIKDSKDTGYRDDIEIEIYERGKGKKRVIIKNGRVQKKPDDIEIIGVNTPNGFIVQGAFKKVKYE